MEAHSWALQSVYQFIQQEYTRACLITYESRPKGGFQEGWGRPGTNLEGVRFRTALLDTVREIGASARSSFPALHLLAPE